MKEILIFGSCEALDQDLLHAMREKFRLVPVQNNAKENAKKGAAAVVLMHKPSDLDGSDFRSVPFVVISDGADAESIARAVKCGAKYFFVSPVPAEMFLTRLDALCKAAETPDLFAQMSNQSTPSEEISEGMATQTPSLRKLL